jgi:hypothetical protein
VASPGQQRRRISGETRLDRLVRKPSGESRGGSSLQRPALKSLHAKSSSFDTVAPPPPALPKPRKTSHQPSADPATTTKDEPFYDMVANEDAAFGEDEQEEEEDEYDNHLLYEVKGRKVREAAAKHGGHRNGQPEAATTTPRLSTGGGGASGSNLSRAGSEVLSSSTDTDGFPGSPSLIRKLAAADMEEEETNYVNIQYFLHATRRSGSGSAGSDGMLNRQDSIDPFDEEDEVDKESDNDDAQQPVVSPPRSLRPADDTATTTTKAGERVQMCRHILTSILESESIYLECLSVCLQYMKAMKVTLATPSPVIPKEDFEIIFYKVPELYEFHHHFHDRKGHVQLRNHSVPTVLKVGTGNEYRYR